MGVPHATSPITNTSASAPSVVSPLVAIPGVSQFSKPEVAEVVPVGSFMAQGLPLLPADEGEMWLGDEEAYMNSLFWLQHKVGPVTDILQWLSCFSALVDVL